MYKEDNFVLFNRKGLDLVHPALTNHVDKMGKINLSQQLGKEFIICGFVYKHYDDGYRCFLVTFDSVLLRMPKWFSSTLNNLSEKELEYLKSGDVKITNIRRIITNHDLGFYTTGFDLVDKNTKKIFISTDKSMQFGSGNFIE